MTDRDIMQQALEALELVTDLTNHDDAIYAAIDALRERLAQPEQEPVIDHSCKDAYELIMKWADIYAVQTGCIYSEAAQDPSKVARMADERTMLACAVAQALSQPAQQQEPVAHTLNCVCGAVWDVSPNGVEEMVHAPNPPQRKPVAHTTGHCENHKQKGGCQLHNLQCGWPDCDRKPITAPPQRKPWVGLTDEELEVIANECRLYPRDFARAIEAKLREKNRA